MLAGSLEPRALQFVREWAALRRGEILANWERACWRSAGPAWPGHVLGAAAVTARAAVVSTVSRAGSSTLLRAAAHARSRPGNLRVTCTSDYPGAAAR